MKPTQALTAAVLLSLWALSVVAAYFILGAIFQLAWPYWAFGWMLAVLLLLLPQSIYSTIVKAEYRNPSRRGAMRSTRDADRR